MQPRDFTVGWVCALPHELAASKAMLDAPLDPPPPEENDDNTYTTGRVGHHNIVMVCLPAGKYGTEPAAVVVKDMLRSFPAIKFNVLVGIGGGVPSATNDIRLGDVVVSKPAKTHGGVVQYDLGKTLPGGSFERRGHLNKPPAVLLNAVNSLQAEHEHGKSRMEVILQEMSKTNPVIGASCARPAPATDPLSSSIPSATIPVRSPFRPVVHYGLVASGSRVIADARERDKLAAGDGALCFEMEAAGLMDIHKSSFLVIRGISDYADGQKNDTWQNHAAAVAAAYAKELLQIVPASRSAEDQAHAAQHHTAATPIGVLLLFQNVRTTHSFFGRDEEIAEMERFFLPRMPSTQSREVFVLRGTGGMGKTQLALHFARKHRLRYNCLLWINGTSVNTIKQSFRSLLKQASDQGMLPVQDHLADEEVVHSAHTWLCAPSSSSWLLVVDNVDLEKSDPQWYDLEQFLPRCDHGHILITTRLSSLQRLGQCLELQILDENSARRLLEHHIRRPLRADDNIDGTLQRLQGLPLALTLAGLYVASTGSSLNDYNEFYDQQWIQLIEDQDEEGFPEYSQPMLNTWGISYEQVRRKNPASAQLLDLFSFLSNSSFTFEMIERVYESCENGFQWPAWLVDLASGKMKFARAMKWLLGFGLVSQTESGAFAIHPVVHEWSFHMLMSRDLDGCRGMCEVGLAVVASHLPYDENHNDFDALHRELAVHVSQVYIRLQQNFGREWTSYSFSKDSFLHLGLLGACIEQQERFSDAQDLLQCALAGAARSYSEDDERLIWIMNYTSDVHRELGNFVESERLSRRARHLALKAFGLENSVSMSSTLRLSTHYLMTGAIQQAKELNTEVLQASLKVLGDGHLLTITSLINESTILSMQYDYAQARAMAMKAISGNAKLRGPGKERIFPYPLIILATISIEEGRYDEAEAWFCEALEMYEALMGDAATALYPFDHLQALANFYILMERDAEAEPIYRRSLKIGELKYGQDSLWVLHNVTQLRDCLVRLAKDAEARELGHRLQTGLEKLARDGEGCSWIALQAITRLGPIYLEQGRIADAEEMLLKGRSLAPEFGSIQVATVANWPTNGLEELAQKLKDYSTDGQLDASSDSKQS